MRLISTFLFFCLPYKKKFKPPKDMFFVLVILKFWRKKDLALYNGDNFSAVTNHYSG